MGIHQVRNVQEGHSDTFIAKLKAAWSIFFPPKPEKVSAKEAGKSRLRMILVADRCSSEVTTSILEGLKCHGLIRKDEMSIESVLIKNRLEAISQVKFLPMQRKQKPIRIAHAKQTQK